MTLRYKLHHKKSWAWLAQTQTSMPMSIIPQARQGNTYALSVDRIDLMTGSIKNAMTLSKASWEAQRSATCQNLYTEDCRQDLPIGIIPGLKKPRGSVAKTQFHPRVAVAASRLLEKL